MREAILTYLIIGMAIQSIVMMLPGFGRMYQTKMRDLRDASRLTGAVFGMVVCIIFWPALILRWFILGFIALTR